MEETDLDKKYIQRESSPNNIVCILSFYQITRNIFRGLLILGRAFLSKTRDFYMLKEVKFVIERRIKISQINLCTCFHSGRLCLKPDISTC